MKWRYTFVPALPGRRRKRGCARVSNFIYLRKLLQMEGILKDVYKEIGGAERAIREEREGYSR